MIGIVMAYLAGLLTLPVALVLLATYRAWKAKKANTDWYERQRRGRRQGTL